MTFWQVVWASALGCAIASVVLVVAGKTLLLIVKGMDAEDK